MAATPSTMMPLGLVAPSFALPDTVSGMSLTLNEVKGEIATLVMFICNHCPFVIHIKDELAQLGRDYLAKGVGLVAISSNDAQGYPQDAPPYMTDFAAHSGFTFPYLYDESQEVAKAYQAACTPDFYIFDKDMKCAYRGQLDDSRPGNGLPVTGQDIRAALDCLIAQKSVPAIQKPSIGCNIKWK